VLLFCVEIQLHCKNNIRQSFVSRVCTFTFLIDILMVHLTDIRCFSVAVCLVILEKGSVVFVCRLNPRYRTILHDSFSRRYCFVSQSNWWYRLILLLSSVVNRILENVIHTLCSSLRWCSLHTGQFMPTGTAPVDAVVWGKIRQNTSSFWKWFCAVAAEELRAVSWWCPVGQTACIATHSSDITSECIIWKCVVSTLKIQVGLLT